MKYTYTCKKVSLNDSIKDYTEKKISKLDRYFQEGDANASVTFAVEKNHLCTVELTIRGGGALLRAQTEAPDGDMRGAVDAAVGYIERQILKNKTRLAKKLRSEGFPAPAASDDFEVLEEKEYSAQTGGGAVSIKMNGKKEVMELTLNPEVVDPDDIEMLQDLIVAAVNQVIRQVEDEAAAAMGKMTGGFSF